MIEGFLKKCFPSFYNSHEKRVSDISKVGYVSLEDYKQDIININNELEEVDLTISYYKDRRRILNEWKHLVEVKISKWNEEDTCCYCRFFNNNYCSKFENNVDSDATCDEFEWR